MKINRFFQNRPLILTLLTIVVILSTTLLQLQKENSQEKDPKLELAQELTPQEYLSVRTKYLRLQSDTSPKEALTKLREETKTNQKLLRSCHALTHELGNQAYTHYQDFGKSLEYQDEICNSGYLHGVIEVHFSKTDYILSTINEVCKQYSAESFKGWQCYHGVGHGVMYYTSNDLPNSIKLCESYTDDQVKMACVNGVYMENFNTDQKIHKSTYLRESNPFYPCPLQAEVYKADCYVYAPTYYLALNKNKYEDALKWCNTAEEKYYSSCTAGVGSQAIKENIQNPKLVEKVCLKAGREGETSCITGMLILYINHFGSIQEATNLCPVLENKHKQLCNKTIKQQSSRF